MTKNKHPNPSRYIILDTNIFQHFGNETLANKIIENLRYAVSQGYGLAMSQYSLIELVDNASVETEQRRINAIKGVKHFKVKQSTLIAAGHLGSLYKEDGMEEKQQPERGDKIIGATAVLNNCVIYTTNGKDFPPPYFKEIARHYLPYTKAGRDVAIMGYFLEPDLKAIEDRNNSRTKAMNGDMLVSETEKTELE
jgi:predicted nucleic acid-binding protein